ncbi:MAG: DUF402 domain-containing protein [Chloroflexi bacterium]|nr:DUF402 domain-containing protein [Chloroflexota bacterium]
MKPFHWGDKVVEHKERLDGTSTDYENRCIRWNTDELVVLYIPQAALHFPYLEIPPGSVSFGYFWPSRPYNAYVWVSADCKLLGAYCNVATATRFSPGIVAWRDLIVDVLLQPDKPPRVLDLDEMPADIDTRTRAVIDEGLDQLLHDTSALLAYFSTQLTELCRASLPWRTGSSQNANP